MLIIFSAFSLEIKRIFVQLSVSLPTHPRPKLKIYSFSIKSKMCARQFESVLLRCAITATGLKQLAATHRKLIFSHYYHHLSNSYFFSGDSH